MGGPPGTEDGIEDRRPGERVRDDDDRRPRRRAGSTRQARYHRVDASAAHGFRRDAVVGEGDPPGPDPAAEELDVGRGSAVHRVRGSRARCSPPARRSPSAPPPPSPPSSVTLAVTVVAPGFARNSATDRPDPPPWGQIHAPDGAVPASAAAGAWGPVRSSHSIAATSRATDPSANRICPRAGSSCDVLIGRPASWSPTGRRATGGSAARPGSWRAARLRAGSRTGSPSAGKLVAQPNATSGIPSGPRQLPLRVVLRREVRPSPPGPDRPTLRARAAAATRVPSATWRSWTRSPASRISRSADPVSRIAAGASATEFR